MWTRFRPEVRRESDKPWRWFPTEPAASRNGLYGRSQQLERKCEETIIGLLWERYGFERIPVPTEALTILIEADLAMSLAR